MNLYVNCCLFVMAFCGPFVAFSKKGYLTEGICDSLLAVSLIVFLGMNEKPEDFRIVLIVLTVVYFLFDIYRCLTREEYLNLNYATTFLFYAFLFKRLFLER